VTKTVLLADDSSTIRKIVELTFTGTELRVEAFDNGKDAMTRLAESTPDLVLADVVMPGPSGYEICRAVKAANSAVPVVLLSSTFEPYDAQLAQESGADSHLVKPFESDTLLRTVRQLLDPPKAESEPKSVVDTVEIDQPLSPTEQESATGSYDDLDERLVEAVSRVVIERLSADVVREIARDVVPDLAERIIRERLQQFENEDS
jgi:CheY-like chemotaxis protein